MQFENSFQTLPKIFFERVQPTPLTNAKLVMRSQSCSDLLNCYLNDSDLTAWLNGQKELPGEQRIATRYAGHQFGVWAGQLGDGRAISLGEVINENQRWEIQTKGSGLTPFSRMGDGKAVIRSSVREFLCSEAMHALGVPTTRALALLTGDDPVERESLEKSALVARVFPSNLRFGHFEYAYHFGHHGELMEIAEYSRKNFFPGAKDILEMLAQIIRSTAQLIAKWQSIGFCHGVMNSDNMSLLSFTIDYGPFGFMENFNPAWICNHSDHQGRYTYQNQPYIGLWNLDRLLTCFQKTIDPKILEELMALYQPAFLQAHLQEFSKKLALTTSKAGDEDLIEELLTLLIHNNMDFTHSFRNLSEDLCAKNAEMKRWWLKYAARLQGEGLSAEDVLRLRKQSNPKYVLRNYIAQEVIADVEAGSTARIKDWMKVLEKPFEEHPSFERYSLPTPEDLRDIEVSCSS